MPAKDPSVVLGVEPGASIEEIKAAWRSLARQHHPDLTGDDPDVAGRATRRMAEINAAYAALTRGDGARPRRRTGRDAQARAQQAGPPASPPTRPVTGRLDMTGTFQPRNQVTTPPGFRQPLRGLPPRRHDRTSAELRASQPTSPAERGWIPDHARRLPPDLDEALAMEIGFGKFHGHTLGAVAAFEPSYIDWLAGTLARDPELAAAARVVAAELDRQGVRRQHRPARPGWRSDPFR